MPRIPGLTSWGIGTKLIALIGVLLSVSITSLVAVSTYLFIDDNKALIQKMNADVASSLALQMRELVETSVEKMKILGTILVQQPDTDARRPVVAQFFGNDKDFLALFVHKIDAAGQVELGAKGVSPEMTALSDPEGTGALSAISAGESSLIRRVARGASELTTFRLNDGSPAILFSVPFIQAAPGSGVNSLTFSHTLTAVIRQTRFLKAFAEIDLVTSYLVDGTGRLLAHPDANRVAAAESVAHLDIVKQLLEGKFNNGQKRYVDPQTGEARLGAFRTIGFAGLGVIAEMPEAKAFAVAYRVGYRSILIALVTLSIAFLAGYFFSGSLTWPIQQLAAAARRISAGDFKIHLQPRSGDEVGRLSLAFNEMAHGLEERDRVKATFAKFHSKEIADKLLSGEVKLGGERREATIFFSDVRGFTAMSEKMEPEQVVELLNEYMTRMVAIIRQHGGVVDKYVGDAIMALWGVPLGSPKDTENAVRACLAMRLELACLNELREKRGQPVLRIGMGLNTGSVIAGNIGSDEKMEYTVIGDSVNLASRIESMTKEFGTDLLISKRVADAVAGKFMLEPCQSIRVKGKAQSIDVFQVRGYVDENGKSLVLETPYSSYKAEKSDKVVHDSGSSVAVEESTRSTVIEVPPYPKNNSKKVA